MRIIILEGVLTVATIAALVALLAYMAVEYTPLGTWLRQNRNRRIIERDAALTCPIHGKHAETELVRLPAGQRLCPECYAEAVHGNND